MGTDICGWVEVPKFEIWRGVIQINGLLYRNYRMFEFLFGVRNHSFPNPIAERRGLPTDLSWQAKQDTLLIEDARDQSWIMWEELKSIQWEMVQDLELSYDWRLLFTLMNTLAEQDYIGPEKIRLIVGFW